MANPPYYPYWPADFDEDTASWNNEEVGIYQRLLNYSWINGWNSNEGLPDDPKRLANIVRCSYKKFQKRWEIISKKFFKTEGGFLKNRRQEEERNKIIKYLESQSESGRRGVEAKRLKGIFPFDKSTDPSSGASSNPSTDPASERQAVQISNKDKEEERVKKEEEIIALCDEIAKLIPKKVFNSYSFNNKHKKKRFEARLYTLRRCKEEISKNNRVFIDNPWPYLNHIVGIEHLNSNEADAIKEHDGIKEEMKVLTEGLKKRGINENKRRD